jgi:hypothetical protein
MVNTFCLGKDPVTTAKLLDYRRLGKQRVEAWQIYRVVTGVKDGWRNHPACQMWMGYADALAVYFNAMVDEWVARGYKNTMKKLDVSDTVVFPAWFGWEPLVASHMASLNRKAPEYYHFDVSDEFASTGYLWPSKVDKVLWGKKDVNGVDLCVPISIPKASTPPSKRVKIAS